MAVVSPTPRPPADDEGPGRDREDTDGDTEQVVRLDLSKRTGNPRAAALAGPTVS